MCYVLVNTAAQSPTYYVGKANNPELRLKQHFAAAFSPRKRFHAIHLYNAIRKYGAHSFALVEKHAYSNEADAFRGETLHIARYRSLGLALYNKSDGGYGGQVKQDDVFTRRKKSLSARILNLQESVRRRKSEALKGHVKSLATRQKLSQSKKVPVRQLDDEGRLVSEHPSALDAEKSTGVSRAHICQVCKGQRNSAGGYKWTYVGGAP